MDTTAITLLAATAWPLIQPLVSAGLGKAAEKIGESLPGKIWELIKPKLEAKPEAKKVLTVLQNNPNDKDVQATFRYQLRQLLEEDDSFAADLGKMLEAASSDFKAQNTGNGAIAQGTGSKAVGQNGMIIEGDVTGNITIGNNNTINHP